MSDDSLEAEELQCSSQLVPLGEFPFGGARQDDSNEGQQITSKRQTATSPDLFATPRMTASTPHGSAGRSSGGGGPEAHLDGMLTAPHRSHDSSDLLHSPMDPPHGSIGAAAPPAKLPPLKHMLVARDSLPLGDAELESLAPPPQKLRPASASQLEARLAYAQQHGAPPSQRQPGPETASSAASVSAGQQQADRFGLPDSAASPAAAVSRQRAASASPAGLNVRELMAAAAAARQLEAEVQREAAERQRCSAALEEAHAAHNQMADKMEQLHGLLQSTQAQQQRSSGEAQDLRAANDRLNAEVQQLRDQLQAGSGAQQRAAAELQELRTQNSQLQQQLQEAARQAAASQAADMHEALTAAEAEIARLNRAGKAVSTEASALQEQLAAVREEAQAAHATAEAEARRARESQGEADEAHDAVQRLQQELAFARQRAEEAAQEGQGLHGATGRLRDENGRLASQLAHLRAQLDRATSELTAKSAETAALARNLAEAEAAADAATRDSAGARRRIADLERHGATLQAQAMAARDEAADLRARCRRLERASFSAMGASPTGSASPGMPPQPLATPPDMQPVAMHGGGPGGGDKSAHRLAAPATPSPQELDRRRSFRDSGDGAAYGAPPRPDPSRPVTPELPPHPQPAYQQAAYQQAAYQQAAYQQPLHRPPPEHRAPQQESAPRHTHTDDYAPSPSQQRQPQHAQLRTPPQHSLARAEAEEFFMQRGARRATVEGGGDAERSGNRPFGTEQSLEELMQQTKEQEDALMRLMMERNELSCEFAKMPAHGGRTLAERRRKAQLEARLEAIDRSASALRLHLKRLGAA